MGKCSGVWKVLRYAREWTLRYLQSRDPISSRVYSESTKLFNAAISCRCLTNLNFISVTGCSNPSISCSSLYYSSVILPYCSQPPTLVHRFKLLTLSSSPLNDMTNHQFSLTSSASLLILSKSSVLPQQINSVLLHIF